MLLQQFEQSPSFTNKARQKKVKKQYSAGFRNYHPEKCKLNSSETVSTSYDWIDQLKIGHLKEHYIKNQIVPDHRQQLYQSQVNSVQRLITTVKKPQPLQEQPKNESLIKEMFNKTYKKDESFEDKAKLRVLKQQYLKLTQKLKSQYTKSKIKDSSFNEIIIKFILQKYEIIKEIDHQLFILQFINFLNGYKNNPNKQNHVISWKEFQELQLNNIFVYVSYKFTEIPQNINKEVLQSHIRQGQTFLNEEEINQIWSLVHKKYTVPYQTHLYQLKSYIPKKQESEVFQKFHAKPIPKTNYQKPKQRPKSAAYKTQIQPFHLSTNNQKKVTIQDYYKWDRNFHAGQIPKSTYKPHQFAKGQIVEKTKLNKQLVQTSSFPATMDYLNNYKLYTEQWQQKIAKKYQKNHQVQHFTTNIPNFQLKHKNEIIQLEARKQQNRHLTKPKPFKLSQAKPQKEKNYNQFIPEGIKQYQDLMIDKKIAKSNPKLKPQSTLKFETYVQYRKKLTQDKKNKEEGLKQKKAKQQSKKEGFKAILKDRIQNQVFKLAKNELPINHVSKNTVKVDLQKIYKVQPLLIERQAMKSKKYGEVPKIGWDPII